MTPIGKPWAWASCAPSTSPRSSSWWRPLSPRRPSRPFVSAARNAARRSAGTPMKIEGSYDFPAPRPKVWAALLDPTRLAAAMAGCEKLEAVGGGEYRATPKRGGGAGEGFVRGAAALELAEVQGGTRLSYSADVQIGGLIASVGQRMLGGVAKMILDDFFSRVSEPIQE